jgi:hypothetical protein
MTPRLVVAIASMLLFTSLRAAPPAYVYYPDLRAACQKIARMSIGPAGVTRAQANVLADTYFQIYLGQCGGAEPVRQIKGFWSAPVVAGYAGVRDGVFASTALQVQSRIATSPRFTPKISHVHSFGSIHINRPNQSMKPTAPLRNTFSVFATTPCRGLSPSR